MRMINYFKRSSPTTANERRSRHVVRFATATLACSALLATGLPVFAADHPVTMGAAEAAGKDWSFNPVTQLTAESFASPPDHDRPWVRWNLSSDPDSSTLEAQLQEMYDKGIRGVEIGQGGFPNNEQLEAIYAKSNSLGMKVSLSHGPTKGIADPDAENVRKSLFVHREKVAAGDTVSGELQRPAPDRGGEREQTLVAVLAYRCADATCDVEGQAELDPSSVVDLTERVMGTNTQGFAGGTTTGTIEWTAPSEPEGAAWQLIGFWARGVFGQSDPLSAEGHQEVVDTMRAYFTPEVTELIRANGGDIFYDSHSSDRGAPKEVWTNNFDAEFKERKGYDLIPNLAAAMRGTFTFTDGSHERVFDDIVDARTDLWLDVHIQPMQQFIRDEYNSVMRLQPEGENSAPIFDMAAVASILDRPEHENLYASDEIDNYLPIASANHMTGNPWYSTECCALGGGNYLGTFEDMLIRMAKSYAGGITKLVYHTYAYSDSPDHRWPGYANWGNTSFGTAWGPRTPNWQDAAQYNDYFARHEQVLTQGDAKVDVAVFYQNYLYPEAWSTDGGFRTWRDMGLQNAGYTRDYLSPELLDLPNAVVADGQLAVDGPAYKALIIDTTLEPSTDPVKTSMPLDAAQRILGYAEAGLPILLVGDLPDRTTGNTPDSDEALQDVVAQLVATPGVHRVESQSSVPTKLSELGIDPAVKSADPATLVSQRRLDADTSTSYFFLYNEGRVGADGRPEQSIFEPEATCAGTGGHVCVGTGEALSTTVSLEGEGYPFLLDAANGEISAIAQYSVEDGHTHIPLEFARDESKIIALAADAGRFGLQVPDVHALTTDADGGAAFEDGRIVVRSVEGDEAKTVLSDGSEHTTEFGEVPDTIDLTDATWTLHAEDWKPANDWATTFGPAAAETVKESVDLTLEGLTSWREIPELADASGIGSYTTTFELPSTWSDANGAFLELGTVVDSFNITVNGEPTAIDQTTSRADLRRHLKAGENTLVVEVATTLNNRLASLDERVANRGHLQNNGLLGPVILTPYETAAVSTATPDLSIVAAATPKAVDGEVVLDIDVTNTNEAPVEVTVETPFDESDAVTTLASDPVAIDPGASVTVSVRTGEVEIPAGEAVVDATAVIDDETVTATATAPYEAFAVDNPTDPGDEGGPGDDDSGGGADDGDLAVTGGTIALGVLILAVLLLAGGVILVRQRRRVAGAEDSGTGADSLA